VSESETQKVMRRLSKDNVKEFGRKLGKVAHANPLAVMTMIVFQIEAYTNMITPVVDAFKYLGPMVGRCRSIPGVLVVQGEFRGCLWSV
jgi:THO complex subunit 2